jgi:phosphohistidine phosphatase SixA
LIEIPENAIVYIARHAVPDRSRLDLSYHVPPGPDLTEKGRAQAAELGEFLREAGVRHILSSPLERSWQTAKIAGEICGATVEMNLDLAEMRMDELQKMIAERMTRAFALACRLSAADGPVALVSHGMPVLSLVKELGLEKDLVEKIRIYDSRNLIPMGGAWEARRSLLRLVFAPDGVEIKNPL